MAVLGRIFNTAGRLQYDLESPVFQLAAKPPLVASAAVYQRVPARKIAYDYDLAKFPILAIKPRGYAAAFMGLTNSPTPRGYNLAVGNAAIQVDAYAFQAPEPAVNATGVIVFRTPSGVVTYDSSLVPMRIAGVFQSIGGEIEGVFVGTPGRSYAAAIPGYIGGWRYVEVGLILVNGVPTAPEEPYYAQRGYALSVMQDPSAAHQLIFSTIEHSGSQYGETTVQGPTRFYNGSVFVIDVTDL